MFDTDNKDEWYDSVFMQCYKTLDKMGHLKTSFDIQDKLQEDILNAFITCNICSNNFSLRNILHLEIDGHYYHIIFVEIDLGVSFNPKSGQHDLGFEHQIWGYATLNTSYQSMLIKPRETEDSVKSFFNKIFGSNEKLVFKNPNLNKKYTVEGVDEQTESFFTNVVFEAIEPIDNLNLIVNGSELICGFYKQISSSLAQQLNDFFRKSKSILK